MAIGYKEFHSPFQTSIVIKIFMSLRIFVSTKSIESLQSEKFNSIVNCIEEISVKSLRDVST